MKGAGGGQVLVRRAWVPPRHKALMWSEKPIDSLNGKSCQGRARSKTPTLNNFPGLSVLVSGVFSNNWSVRRVMGQATVLGTEQPTDNQFSAKAEGARQALTPKEENV